MPRREIPFLPGDYYHFYSRGNNRQPVFFEAANYLNFLRGVRRYLCPLLDPIAYCLMPTHYHLLGRVKTSEVFQTSEVSHAMQRFLISYTKAINKRFGRVGTLFQGAFQAKPIRDYDHLRRLCVYIHANPVKDGLAAAPADWPHSNYRDWLGLRDGTLPDRDFAREHFGTPDEYAALVRDYLASRDLPDEMRKYLQGLAG